MGFEPGSAVVMRPVVGRSYLHSTNLIGENKSDWKKKVHIYRRPKNIDCFVITLLPVEEQTEKTK